MKKSFDPGRIQPLHFLKCVFCLFLCLLLCFPSLQPVSAAQSADQNRETESQENTSVSGPEVSAPSALLMDADTGTVLYAKDENTEIGRAHV